MNRITSLCIAALTGLCAVPAMQTEAQAQLKRVPDASQVRVMSLPEAQRIVKNAAVRGTVAGVGVGKLTQNSVSTLIYVPGSLDAPAGIDTRINLPGAKAVGQAVLAGTTAFTADQLWASDPIAALGLTASN